MNKSFPTTGTFKKNFKIHIWGDPLTYSLSIFFQEHVASLNGYRLIYSPFRGSGHSFKKILSKKNCAGANITMPFKVEALSMCDQLTEAALCSGSVNTIFKSSGKLVGDNTDGEGLFKWMEMRSKLDSVIQIIGNGGSARAIAYTFFKNKIKVIICGRKFKGWEENFGKFVSLEKYSPDIPTVNTLPFPIRGKNILDISYEQGDVPESAKGMLACQGALSFEKWMDKKIPFETYIKLTSLHAKAHSNTFLLSYLAGRHKE